MGSLEQYANVIFAPSGVGLLKTILDATLTSCNAVHQVKKENIQYYTTNSPMDHQQEPCAAQWEEDLL